MTLEEALQLAENGDIGSMISLGDYYFRQNTGQGITQAAEWYESAAKKNVAYAVHMTVFCKKILAIAGIQIASHDELGTEFAMGDWKEAYQWAAKEMEYIQSNATGFEKINVDEAMQNYVDASYYLALVLLSSSQQYPVTGMCATL